ncbi:hypothetical protein HRG_002116 [Hirsutella rhossiliensis]|uniref:Uncharacterized protein n=1 Tax=Hirsutella rhossiliensis TaxID=111463 RepID=A0A9P8N4B9_9HYPO|nr:uncharacterized protein HRG_02116 [Hirsutella rhossiliensis]KAH0966707.1 hypothetical protein HRG_02116 [Hirsutella rhossiliensis]
MEPTAEHLYALSDSGQESAISKEAPGGCTDFALHANTMFVTYTGSRIHDKEEFHQLLRESLTPGLPRISGTNGKVGTVKIFGSRQLHDDGTRQYHVLLMFHPRVHWNSARDKLSVWMDVDGNREVDTTDVEIRKKPFGETAAQFLQSVQDYIARGGDVFGERMSVQSSPDGAGSFCEMEALPPLDSKERKTVLFIYFLFFVKREQSRTM